MLGSPSHNFRAGLDAKFSCKALFALEGLLILQLGIRPEAMAAAGSQGSSPPYPFRLRYKPGQLG